MSDNDNDKRNCKNREPARMGADFVNWDEAKDHDICELNAHIVVLIHDLNWLLFKPYALETLLAALEEAREEVQRELRKRSGLA